ncbi:hypothetical protein AOPFMNJM_1857 [Methylobacterium jeotgali]|uniref:ABC transporter permease n=1 Tax=Methylobacterium jeotgali TaxID=381630 RepID=A0ABQ4STU7_9HYPH|nr:hypothetical protein AwMethylo_40170 [Methylobacterium sp.]GJE06537.1 hypothetical protein AOPFMNJM_1857 [Methylobacterium jeotgali]
MDQSAWNSATTEWRAYGARDAIVFALGFILALMLIVPFA